MGEEGGWKEGGEGYVKVLKSEEGALGVWWIKGEDWGTILSGD